MVSTTEHVSKKFDAELESLRSRVMQMGGLIETQINRAIDAFMTGDLDAMEQVIADDHQVNGFEVSIDDDCAHIVARRQPTAGDLRMVMATSCSRWRPPWRCGSALNRSARRPRAARRCTRRWSCWGTARARTSPD